MLHHDAEDEDWYDDEDDDQDDSDSDAIPCPECGVEIYADLDHCPRCGHWLTDADRQPAGTGLFATRRVRQIALALLIIFVVSLLIELLIW
jgi:uncharacterized paraquat-inducible protein A